METNNVKASEQVALLGSIAPISEAIGTVTTGWIPATDFQKFLGKVQTGVLGASGTVGASWTQAQDNIGTNAKALGTSIAPITVSGQAALMDLDAQQLDVEGGFGFIELSVAVGVAASEIAVSVLGFNPRYAPASAFNVASVAQVVG